MHTCIKVEAAPSSVCDVSQYFDWGQRHRHAVIVNLNKEQSQVNVISGCNMILIHYIHI
jgi:hypothetical protein